MTREELQEVKDDMRQQMKEYKMIPIDRLNNIQNENLCKQFDLDSYSIDFNDRAIEETHDYDIFSLFGNKVVFSGKTALNSPRVNVVYKGKPYFFFPEISVIDTGQGIKYDEQKMELEIIRLIEEIKELLND